MPCDSEPMAMLASKTAGALTLTALPKVIAMSGLRWRFGFGLGLTRRGCLTSGCTGLEMCPVISVRIDRILWLIRCRALAHLVLGPTGVGRGVIGCVLGVFTAWIRCATRIVCGIGIGSHADLQKDPGVSSWGTWQLQDLEGLATGQSRARESPLEHLPRAGESTGPGNHSHGGVLVDRITSARVERHHVAVTVRTPEEVPRVDEVSGFRHGEATDTTVQHDRCIHVFER